MPMNKRIFNQYISESNFRELFILEMGWNNPNGQTNFDLTIDETVFDFTQIAERNGFQVFTCEVPSIPTSSMCKKIDSRLRRLANDYICIYHLPQSEHHLWVVPVKKVEKRDLVLIEYMSAAKAEFLYDKMERISFDLDERTTIMDVKERIQGGFIINSEKITKDFYTGFRKEHTSFAKYITGLDDEITDLKKNKKKQWYTSVMLNRLMFCYFIQKKGFLDLNANYLRDKLNWVKCEKGEDRFYGTFYRGFLLSLFHDGLNSPRHQPDFEKKYGRIPYLNGGMFSIHELEDENPELDIADEAFESLFAFFDQWHWHLDDRLTASGKDINPDVLGYIFEQYINDRAQMGAYYTKEDITEYIGRNTIVPFLMNATKKADERPFKTNGEVWQFLKESGDTYIFDAVKKGKDEEIPEEIAVGIDTTKPNLLERRSRWNEKTPEAFALPTEIWRETIERLQRYQTIKDKITNGEITEINDFITYNLDIRQFVQDLLAQTSDHLLVKHFYAQLRKVTILDPTCGSGAFLFAALNILEPLYEVCIECMQTWNNENPNLFKEELEELYGRYRSNIRYFIYKNIILRNLYGVDIMVEATEIAKLRLFLKMVAVVDVDRRDQNLGLDPLPDIDFNIRCGNTLVGYATEKEMEEGVKYMDMFARQEFEEKVYQEMDIVSRVYETFKKVQLTQDADLETFRQAKKQLKERLKVLNELLNQTFHKATCPGMEYGKWKSSHQPFHWLAEYYDIINGNGGFDVIIGNPPYVVYNQSTFEYQVKNIVTIKARNLYAFCIERSLSLINTFGRISMIVPISLSNGNNYTPVRKLLSSRGTVHYSHYAGDSHPSCLFNGVQQNLSIFILSAACEQKVYSTNYIKFYIQERPNLYSTILYFDYEQTDNEIFRVSSQLQQDVVNKVKQKEDISTWITKNSNFSIYFKNTSGAAYKPFFSKEPFFEVDGVQQVSKTIETISYRRKEELMSALALYNSNLFNFLFYLVSDARHITPRETYGLIKVNDKISNDNLLHQKAIQLEKDYYRNAIIVTYNKKNGITKYAQFNPRLSKPIIDEIDKVLAKHYGFTEEELDFIINYDIKYRMGDELNENEE